MNHFHALTPQEHDELRRQYVITPRNSAIDIYSEHRQLRHLLEQFGYTVSSDRGAELELASRLLSQYHVAGRDCRRRNAD